MHLLTVAWKFEYDNITAVNRLERRQPEPGEPHICKRYVAGRTSSVNELVYHQKVAGHNFILHRPGRHHERRNDEIVKEKKTDDDNCRLAKKISDFLGKRYGRFRFLVFLLSHGYVFG